MAYRRDLCEIAASSCPPWWIGNLERERHQGELDRHSPRTRGVRSERSDEPRLGAELTPAPLRYLLEVSTRRTLAAMVSAGPHGVAGALRFSAAPIIRILIPGDCTDTGIRSRRNAASGPFEVGGGHRSSLNPASTAGLRAAFATYHPVRYIHCAMRVSLG